MNAVDLCNCRSNFSILVELFIDKWELSPQTLIKAKWIALVRWVRYTLFHIFCHHRRHYGYESTRQKPEQMLVVLIWSQPNQANTNWICVIRWEGAILYMHTFSSTTWSPSFVNPLLFFSVFFCWVMYSIICQQKLWQQNFCWVEYEYVWFDLSNDRCSKCLSVVASLLFGSAVALLSFGCIYYILNL